MKQVGLAVGFSLIEMAIVLVVIGLLLSGGLLAVAPVLNGAKVSQTTQKLDRIEQALVLYAIRNSCLPCPANNAADSRTVTTAGQGSRDGGTFYSSGCATACDVAIGGVPWVTLGLSEEEITDGWSNRIRYSVSDANIVTSGMLRTPPSTYPAGDLTVTNIGAVVTSTTVASYVLFSQGPDSCLANAASIGTQRADIYATTPCGGAGQAENLSDDNAFVQDDPVDMTGDTHFDDIVRWRSAPLIIQLCGSNACGNPA